MPRTGYGFPLFDWCAEHEVSFITRARTDATYDVTQVLEETDTIHDRLIQFGQFRSNPCRHPVRLVEIQTAQGWRQYLTNVLNPTILSAQDVAALYPARWRKVPRTGY